ncbi:MAG: ribosome hibernation-promoting factor, HPF/YfiA family [Acidimicrobiales bacterium]
MDVAIRCHEASVPEDLRTLTEAKVAKLARYAPVLEYADVRLAEFSSGPATQRGLCEVTIVGHGHVLRTRTWGHDLPSAVDRAVDKLTHQAMRLKGKLVRRSHPKAIRAAGRS